ncbi:hypothetical protein V8G54_009234 [Vigna mungo]|uniref:Uncharacterized protein n=1 Tax=Vigna mungo TaxID=3915 RepID=A0AAQ3NWT3_VIGMU
MIVCNSWPCLPQRPFLAAVSRRKVSCLITSIMAFYLPSHQQNGQTSGGVMEKEWTKFRRFSTKYINGLDSFLDFAYTRGRPQGRYGLWVHHGEQTPLPTSKDEDMIDNEDSHDDINAYCMTYLEMWMKMSLVRPLLTRQGFSTSSENLVASVLLERLPVVIPKIDPVVYAFQEFSFRWRQQYQRRYPDEFLDKSEARGKGDYQIDYVPAPRFTEADKNNDKRYAPI